HAGIARTYQHLPSLYFFRKMLPKVEEYVRTCDPCLRNKPVTHKQFGELQWIRAPMLPWSLVTLDFMVKFPSAYYRGHDFQPDAVLSATCKTTRLTRFIPGCEAWTAERWA
ncbi:hypothetical protein BJ508DRAFT_190675, partial [Ascobolus immersus RN42]